MASFNLKLLRESIATSDIGVKRIQTVMDNKFEAAHEKLMEDFDEDVVTQEIESRVGNPSNTLPGAKDGNLFSFIGFEDEGDDPIAPVREILQNDLELSKIQNINYEGNKIKYKFYLKIPTQKIHDASKMPWENGLSWVEQIERGISGFSNYVAGLFKNPPSRSTEGVEAKNPLRAQQNSTPRDYLTALFEKFKSNFKNS